MKTRTTTLITLTTLALLAAPACKNDTASATSNPESVSAEALGEGVDAEASNVDGASAIAEEEDGMATAEADEGDAATAEVTDEDDSPQ